MSIVKWESVLGFSQTLTVFLISSVVTEHLKGKDYDPEQAPAWCKTITEAVKERVKNLGMDRYKVSLTVII